MTDQTAPLDSFEGLLGRRLLAASDAALRPFDPAAITSRAAAGVPARAADRAGRGTRWYVLVAAALLLLGVLAVAAASGGLRNVFVPPLVPTPTLEQLLTPSPFATSSALAVVSASASASATASPLSSLPAFTTTPSPASPTATTTLSSCDSPAATPPPGTSGYHLAQLAYWVDGPPPRALYVSDGRGCNARLIASPVDVPMFYGPVLSYIDLSGQHSSLVALQPDGTSRVIGPDPDVPLISQISPDGRTFALLRPDRLTMVTPDGSRRDLALPDGYAAWDASDLATVSWMPDGSAVLVGACVARSPCVSAGSKGDTQHAIFLVPTNGRPPTLVAPSPAVPSAVHALLSPDGTRIVFEGCNESDQCGLGVMQSDGSDPNILEMDPPGAISGGFTYAWSADSSEIAYSYYDGNASPDVGVSVIAADGASPARRLVAGDGTPTPDPSGNQVGDPGNYLIEGFAPDASEVLVDLQSGGPADGLELVPTDGEPPTLLVPGAAFGTGQWAPDE